MDNFILVRLYADTGEIMTVVRSFLSRGRAEQDMELLQEINPDGKFMIITINHIDN